MPVGNIKTKHKIFLGFFVMVVFVILSVAFSMASMSSIQDNRQKDIEFTEYVNKINGLRLDVVRVTETDNISEYNILRDDVQSQMLEIDAMHQKIDSRMPGEVHSELLADFEKKMLDFYRISDEILFYHKDKLDQEDVFLKKYDVEKAQRYKIRSSIYGLNDLKMSEHIGFIQYYSKETLFQYRDKEHLNDWLGCLDNLSMDVKSFRMDQQVKETLLNDISAYRTTAEDMGLIVVRQRTIEREERLKIDELRGISADLEKRRAKVVEYLSLESDIFSNRMYFVQILSGAVLMIALLLVWLYIMRFVYMPLKKLKAFAYEICDGNMQANIDIDSDDDVRAIAFAVKQVATDLRLSESRLKKYAAEINAESLRGQQEKSKELQKKLHEKAKELDETKKDMERRRM